MVVYDTYGARLSLGREVARGSAATLYEIPALTGLLAKIYHTYHEEYEAKLRWMMAHPPVAAEGPNRQVAMAWPRFLLYNAKASFIGYAMPYLQGASSLERLLNGKMQRLDFPLLTRPALHQVAYQLATVVRSLHSAGYVAGTLHANNVLVTPPSWVTLIDTDSIQVQTQHIAEIIWYRPPSARPAYLPPELQGRNIQEVIQAPEQDRFSLAVLIFQLLMEGHHPFHALWRGPDALPPLEERIAQGLYPYASAPRAPITPPPNAPRLEWLHPRLVALFERCFVDGHQATWQRPWPLEWQEALEEAEQALVPCPLGQHPPYSNHLPECPLCATQSLASVRRQAQPRRRAATAPSVTTQGSSSNALYNLLFPNMRGAVLRWWPPSGQTLQLLWALVAPMVLVLSPCILVGFFEALCSALF